jgi:CO/xanthine dehydrogenase Mo-binding subunit
MEKAHMKEFAVIGKNAPITDAREKATGQAIYVDDFKFPHI